MWRRATPVKGCTPGWSTAGAHAARGMPEAPLGPCPPLGPAPFPWVPRRSPPPVLRGPRCAGPPLLGPCGRPGRRPLGCSRCRAWSHPGSNRGQRPVIRAGSGVLLGAPAFPGAVAPLPRGAEGGHAARRRRGSRERAPRAGPWNHLQVGVRIRVLRGELHVAASESQRHDDLVRRVGRRRSGACFACSRGLRHCCVAVPKSRGWGADLRWLSRAPWLVHVLWAWWDVPKALLPKGKRPGCPPTGKGKRAGLCVLCARRA